MRLRRSTAALAALLLGAACTVEPGSLPGREEPQALPDAPDPAPGFGLLTGHGVTEEPCPAAVNPDNGCIRLGALVDTSGPFAAQGRAALAGAQSFWHHVNDQGGVTHKRDDGLEAAYDVSLDGHVEDTGSDVEAHLDALERVEPDVLALGLSMGATATYEALPAHKRHQLLAAPTSWWSGWAFEPLMAGSGASYCLQAINGMDRAERELGDEPIDHVVVVHSRDHYGEDVLRGVEHWTDPDAGSSHDQRVPFDPAHHAVVVEPGGEVTPAVERIVEVAPEVVVLATSPAETAALATRTAERGWQGLLVGAAPTYTPSLLDDPEVTEVLGSRYLHVASMGPLTQAGKAYRDMRGALGLDEDRYVDPDDARLPEDPAWVAGWVSQYPLHHALRHAIIHGDLTRAGLVHVAERITFKYDGALPWTSQDGAPDELVTRRTFVSRVDEDEPLGLRLVGDAYVGGTAQDRYVTRPCTER